MGTRFFAVASVALVMGIALPASAAVIEAGVVGKKLTITDKSGLGASSKMSSVQVRTGIQKGAAGNPSMLSGSFEIIYNGTANDGVFPMPSPWISNSSNTAKFSNRSAPVITEVKVGIVKPQKVAKVVAKGVGGLDISTPPGVLGVTIVYTVNNGIDGNTYKMCTLYATGVGSTIQHKVIAGGMAYSLKLKNGVPTACPSGATTTSTSTSTTVSSSSSSTTLGTTSTSTTSSSSTSSSTTTTVATCIDGVKNGQETDVDCGGTQCPACGPGDDCLVNADCTSSACSALICLPTTTSTSSSTSSSSSSTSTSTTTSTSSSSTSSSTTSSTSTSTTTTLATCTDGMRNGQETDVDCGGPTCPACGPGDDCIINADCTSSACSAMICLPTTTSTSSTSSTSTSSSTTSSSTSTSSSSTSTSTSTTIATCSDGFKNGQETGVDCGGPTCSACGPGGGCAIPRDCTSSVCLSMVCQTPTCNDGVKNQGESDVDCGGPCSDCTLNRRCNVNGDCVSNTCSAGFCKCAVGQVSNTFSITSNSGGSVDPAEWPGGTQVRNFTSECRVTIDNPSGNIDLVGNLGDNFDVISSAGFASCFGSGGEDGNGCDDNGCPPAGIGSCEANRPSCSAALNGSGSATFRVACNP